MVDAVLDALQLSSFPDTYLAIVVPIHAATAIFAAIVLCPGAILARKGTPLHRRFGYSVEISAAIIVLSSFLLLLDQNINDIVVSATVFPRGEYNRFYLLMLSFGFAYYAFSAVRIWHRMPADSQSAVSSNWIDWGLAALGLLTGLAFLTSSIYTLGNNNPLSLVYIQGSIWLIVFSTFDIYTFFAPPHPTRFPWWMLHMAKMILLWIILVRFVVFRLIKLDASEFATHQAIALLIYLAVVGTVAASFRRRYDGFSTG